MITLGVLGVLLIPFVVIGGALALFMKSKRRGILRWSAIAYLLVAFAVILGIGPYAAAWGLCHGGTRPPDRLLRETPASYGAPFEDVVFEARDGVRLRGWLVPPSGRDAVIVCSHGLFRNRVEVLARVMALAKLGYGALIFDFRAHGGSDGQVSSLGYHERNDVIAALEYVRRRYQDAPEKPRIVLMGVSMGAVATLAAAAETRGYSALVLDSPFSSIRQTVIDHTWLFLRMPRYPFPSLFLFWFQRIANADPDRVDSHAALRQVPPVPLLLIASEGDRRIGADVSRRLFQESRSPLKELKVFGTDVTHGASARLHLEEYTAVMTRFLERLPGGAAAANPAQ